MVDSSGSQSVGRESSHSLGGESLGALSSIAERPWAALPLEGKESVCWALVAREVRHRRTFSVAVGPERPIGVPKNDIWCPRTALADSPAVADVSIGSVALPEPCFLSCSTLSSVFCSLSHRRCGVMRSMLQGQGRGCAGYNELACSISGGCKFGSIPSECLLVL
jgi:hypothetical protein